jgi:hypothetical protein
MTIEDAEEMRDGYAPEEGCEYVAVQVLSEHRWYNRRLLAFRRDDRLLGIVHRQPKTEVQEGMDEWESDPVRVYHVDAEPVTKIIYRLSDDTKEEE